MLEAGIGAEGSECGTRIDGGEIAISMLQRFSHRSQSLVYVAVSGVGTGEPEKIIARFLSLFLKKCHSALRVSLQQVHLTQAKIRDPRTKTKFFCQVKSCFGLLVASALKQGRRPKFFTAGVDRAGRGIDPGNALPARVRRGIQATSEIRQATHRTANSRTRKIRFRIADF